MKPGKRASQLSTSLHVDFNSTEKHPPEFQRLRVGRIQTEYNVLFKEHQNVQISTRSQKITDPKRVALKKKICRWKKNSLIKDFPSMSLFSWHMNFQHPVLHEITAIFLQAPINSDGLTDGKHVTSPLNFVYLPQQRCYWMKSAPRFTNFQEKLVWKLSEQPLSNRRISSKQLVKSQPDISFR